MATYHLDAQLAQNIVARTMKIIDSNVNVMDARGRIMGSGQLGVDSAMSELQQLQMLLTLRLSVTI